MAINIIQGFSLGASEPIDERMVVGSSMSRTSMVYKYDGLRVFQTDTREAWAWNTSSNDWELEGFIGPTGSIGATGPQGIDGPQGATGPQGFQGATGPQGFQGSQGPTGPNGIQGATGFQGATGPQGFQGATGPQGFQGATGPQGFQGATGPQGVGIEGPQGPQGATGPQGFQGSIGFSGPQGFQGATGPQGATGFQGATGPQGFQGFQGAAGSVGATGPQGGTGSTWGGFLGQATTTIPDLPFNIDDLSTTLYTQGVTISLTSVYDDDSAYLTSSGIWTCPADGRYDVSFFVSLTKDTDDGWLGSTNSIMSAGIISGTGIGTVPLVGSYFNTISAIQKHATLSGGFNGMYFTTGTPVYLKVLNLTDFDYTYISGDVMRMNIRRVGP